MRQNSSQQEAIITISDLTRRFGQFTAVNGLNLNMRREDVFGVLGPNGSGKTTAIRMLRGLLMPITGKALLFGQDNATHSQEIRPRIGGHY